MAPIHNTDIAQERWELEEWRHVELWEKIELRAAKKRRWWITATVMSFILLASVPVIIDRLPKWHTYSASRKLALLLNDLKIRAAAEKVAFRLQFVGQGSFHYRIERLKACDASEAALVAEGNLPIADGYLLLSPADAEKLQLPGVVENLCYDAFSGRKSGEMTAFGMILAKDLTDSRLDRLSLLMIQGDSAEISFN